MKNRCALVILLMLPSILLIFSLRAYTQKPTITDDSARASVQDLKVSFSGRPAGRDSEFVFGEVFNQSGNRFGCAQLTFDLATSDGRHLGVVSVDVPGLGARRTTQYEQRLPFPTAKITLKSVMQCQGGDILSFTAESTRIRKGDGVTLQWRTANARSVAIGVSNPASPHPTERDLIFNSGRPDLILDRRSVEPSGSWRVFPLKTTTFRLTASNWGTAYKDLTIEVTSEPLTSGVCSITGQVKNYLPIYVQNGKPVFSILLYRAGSETPLVTVTVTSDRYTIPNVPEGVYEIRGKGFYRPNNHAIFADGSQEVTCRNGRANNVNFRIDSGD